MGHQSHGVRGAKAVPVGYQPVRHRPVGELTPSIHRRATSIERLSEQPGARCIVDLMYISVTEATR